jgi:hypothetical protein
MKIGTVNINNCKIGSTQVNEVRIGSTLVWQFSSIDPDAQAFITAAGITNSTQQTAINTLVLSLKSNGLWTKMKAVYPFVGGTASTHKFNLKDPRDLDAAFRLVFSGGWTHSATGATPNGTNGFADTKLSPLSVLSRNNNSIGFYNRKLSPLINTYNGVGNPNWFIIGNADGVNRRIDYWANASTGLTSSTTNAVQSMATGTRTSATLSTIYRNGVFSNNYAAASQILPSSNFYIGAVNTGTGGTIVYNDFEFAFFHISDGLTATEATNFYTAVQAFQTTLGRQV